MMKNEEKKFSEQKNFFYGLLPICGLGRRWRARSAQVGVRGRAGEGAGERWGARGALGRRVAGARAWRAGRGRGALGEQAAWALGRWAARAQARGALERAGARTEGRAERAGQGRLGGRRAAWALGARPGRLGWPWAVHSVHSAHFRSVLTRFFSESPNEHRSL